MVGHKGDEAGALMEYPDAPPRPPSCGRPTSVIPQGVGAFSGLGAGNWLIFDGAEVCGPQLMVGNVACGTGIEGCAGGVLALG